MDGFFPGSGHAFSFLPHLRARPCALARRIGQMRRPPGGAIGPLALGGTGNLQAASHTILDFKGLPEKPPAAA